MRAKTKGNKMFGIFKFKTKEEYLVTTNEIQEFFKKQIENIKNEESAELLFAVKNKIDSFDDRIKAFEGRIKTLETQVETILNIVRR
jgi:hypothetical protein